MRRIKVVCTSRGAHNARVLYQLDVTAEAISEVKFREGNSPVTGIVIGLEDGETVTGEMYHRAILPTPTAKASPNQPWRRRCPTCKEDWPLTDRTVRLWIESSESNTLDVSIDRVG
jgi:hypothetical protein